MTKEEAQTEKKVSKSFINVLATLSILGFLSIISYTIFGKNIEIYIETLWLGIMGLGFIIESKPIALFKRIKNRLGERNFTAMTTFIVGALALIAGILSLPQINIQSPGFLAIKGIVSTIAIIFIIIQTWLIKG
jgi:hypothetical protein